MDVIPQAEERPVDSKKDGLLLILCWNKPLLDLWMCFHGLKVGFGSTPQGWGESIWFNKGYILPAKLLYGFLEKT